MKHSSRLPIFAFLFVFLSELLLAAQPIAVTHYSKAEITNKHCAPMRRPNESVYVKQVDTSDSNKAMPATYEDKFAVKVEDGFSISLHQAYIKDFPEWNILGRKTGDIAIVATVRERTNGTDFDFTSQAATNGRVVFFQENVEAGTTLNLSNVPVYGPAKYTGFPMMITLHVIEIDEKGSKGAKGIIGKLAELSKSVPSMNAKALGVLDTLGSFLLSQNKNDVLARYDMELEPFVDLKEGLLTPTLEYGNYLFVVGDGPLWMSWNGIYFNQKNSRIYKDNTCNTGYDDKTWLTFQINGASPTKVASFPATSTLNTLLEKLGRDAQEDIQSVSNLATSLRNSYQQEWDFAHALQVVKEAVKTYAANGVRSNQLNNELGTIVNDLDSSIGKIRTGVTGSKFTANQCNRLITELRGLLAANSSDRVLISFEGFDSAKVKTLLSIP